MAEENETQVAATAPEAKSAEAEVKSGVEGAESAAEKAAAPAAKSAPSESQAETKPAAAPVTKRRRTGKHVPVGIVHVKATFNNTMVSITDPRGGVVSWCSSGRVGFKGSRKSTAFAATLVAQEAARGAVAKGMHEVEVRIQGAGAGRESAVRGIQSAGMTVTVIKDVTSIAHNGCRARKRRRV